MIEDLRIDLNTTRLRNGMGSLAREYWNNHIFHGSICQDAKDRRNAGFEPHDVYIVQLRDTVLVSLRD